MRLFRRKPKAEKIDPTQSNRANTFYSRESDIININDFLKVVNFQPSKEALVLNTDKEISIAGMSFSDLTPDKLMDTLGEPAYVLDNTDTIPGHHIYYYRQKADSVKFLIQIHFIGDTWIFASNKISASGYLLTKKEKEKIITKLLTKLGVENKYNNETFNVYVKDKNNNKLYTEDLIKFIISYIPNNDTVNMLKSKMKNKEEKDKKESEFDETLGKVL